MKEKVIKNFAAVLVNNFYEKNPNPTLQGAKLILEILSQISEAGEDIPLEVEYNHEKATFTNFGHTVKCSYIFKHEEFPSNTDIDGVKNFVEKILRDVVY